MSLRLRLSTSRRASICVLAAAIAWTIPTVARAGEPLCVEGELDPMPESMLAVIGALKDTLLEIRDGERLEEAASRAGACMFVMQWLQRGADDYRDMDGLVRIAGATAELEEAGKFEDAELETRMNELVTEENSRLTEHLQERASSLCLGDDARRESADLDPLVRAFGGVLDGIAGTVDAQEALPRLKACFWAVTFGSVKAGNSDEMSQKIGEKLKGAMGDWTAPVTTVVRSAFEVKAFVPFAVATLTGPEREIASAAAAAEQEESGTPSAPETGQEPEFDHPVAAQFSVALPPGWVLERFEQETAEGGAEEPGSQRAPFTARVRLAEDTYAVAWKIGRTYVLETALEAGATRQIEGVVVPLGAGQGVRFELAGDPLEGTGRLRSAYLGKIIPTGSADEDAAIQESKDVVELRRAFQEEIRADGSGTFAALQELKAELEAERHEHFARRFAALVAGDEWYSHPDEQGPRFDFDVDLESGAVAMRVKYERSPTPGRWEGRMVGESVVVEDQNRTHPGTKCEATLRADSGGRLRGRTQCRSRWPTGKWIDEKPGNEYWIELY